MPLAWPALGLRVALVGVERVLLRVLGAFAPPTACAAAFFGVGSLVLLPFVRLRALEQWTFLRAAVPAGLLYAVAYWLYVSALVRSDVTAAAPLSGLSSVFVVVLARLVHGEALTPLKVAGATLVAAGAAAAQSGGRRRTRPPFGPAAQMLAYALLSALLRMLDKVGAASPAAAAYAFVVFAETAAGQLLLLAWTGRMETVVSLLRRQPALVAAAGLCNGGSFLLLLYALGHVPVSIADPLTTLSMIVSAAVAAVWLREPVGARLLPTMGVIAGTWLLVQSGS